MTQIEIVHLYSISSPKVGAKALCGHVKKEDLTSGSEREKCVVCADMQKDLVPA